MASFKTNLCGAADKFHFAPADRGRWVPVKKAVAGGKYIKKTKTKTTSETKTES